MTKKKKFTESPTKLHVGCGARRLPGYIHVDKRASVFPDVLCDVDHLGDQIEVNSVDEIYACHVLEHLSSPARTLLLWADLLKQHGILRIAVPDLEGIFEAYNAGVTLPRLSGLIWGRQDYPENTHYHGWDYETLANLLRETGYYDVQRWDPRYIFPIGYHDISYAKIFSSEGEEFCVSLNVEAKKI